MSIQIQRNGTWQKVSKQELLELVSAGVVRPDTAVLYNDQQIVAARLKGLVFSSQQVAVPPPQRPIASQAARAVPVPHSATKQLYCTNCSNAVSEQAAACMACGAKPTGHKKFCRQCGVALNPEQVVCVKCGAGLAGNSAMGGDWTAKLTSVLQATGEPLDPVRRKDRITFWTMLCTVSYVLCFLAGLAVACCMIAVPYIAKDVHEKSTTTHISRFIGMPPNTIGPSYEKVKTDMEGVTGVISLVLVIPTTIAYICCYYIWLLRLWEEIPRRFARTSPVNAALFALIPFYNWYWNFTAFCGLYGDINKATESYGLGSRFDGTWIKMVCTWWVISGVLGNVPPVEPIVTIVYGFLILLGIVCAVITLPTFWTMRKNVLEFIDIKASAGE